MGDHTYARTNWARPFIWSRRQFNGEGQNMRDLMIRVGYWVDTGRHGYNINPVVGLAEAPPEPVAEPAAVPVPVPPPMPVPVPVVAPAAVPVLPDPIPLPDPVEQEPLSRQQAQARSQPRRRDGKFKKPKSGRRKK